VSIRSFVRFVALLCGATGCRQGTIIREEVGVLVGGTHERWSLEWRGRPTEICSPGSEVATTCPCDGFAYGETGAVDLVRRRTGERDERLSLDPLFKNADGGPVGPTAPVLQRWPMLVSDIGGGEGDSAALDRQVRARDVVRLMIPGDYDHDGQATEFLLQVGTAPCGKRKMVLVGVSKAQPTLHAFASVAHPDRPLILDDRVWRELLSAKGEASAVEVECGDHGAKTLTELTIAASAGAIDGSRAVYECKRDGTPGKRLSWERL